MAILDFILNGVALLLWLNWRSRGMSPVGRPVGIELVGTLKRTQAPKPERWGSLIILAGLLLARSVLYWQLGSALGWTPGLSFGAVVLHFRSDLFVRMFSYSWISFGCFLGVFYYSLALLAALGPRSASKDMWGSLIHAHLGFLASWPPWLLLLLPFLGNSLVWLAGSPLLAWLGLQSLPSSFSHLLQQSAVIGLGGWMQWRFVLLGVLGLHVLSSYVYLGNGAFWNYLAGVARNLLRPLAWLPLRFGRIDLLPVLLFFLLGGLMFLFSSLADSRWKPEMLKNPLPTLYQRLPLW